MKRLLAITLILIGLIGCSVANHPWENPVPSEFDNYVNNIIVKGWKLYAEWNFEGAYAKFDSVIMMDAERPDGYIGRGFCSVNLGASNPSSFDEATADFGFVLSINEGGNPIDSVADIPAIYDSMDGKGYYYYVHVDTFLPILMVASGKVTVGSHSKQLIASGYGDNWIKFDAVTAEFVDTANHNTFVPNDTTYFYVNFYHARDRSIKPVSAVVVAGLAQLYQAKFIKEQKAYCMKRSIAHASYVKHFVKYNFEDSLPEYYYDGLNYRNTRIILAQDFFIYEWYQNCEAEIVDIDTSYTFDRTADNYIQQLQQALQSLYEGE